MSKEFTDSKGEAKALQHDFQAHNSANAAAPPYNSTSEEKQSLEPPPSYDSSAYPPLPHHTQAPSQTLYVWYESWLKNDVHILSEDHKILYTIKLKMRKPQITLNSPDTQDTVATVSFSCFSCSMDAVVNDAPFQLTKRGLLKLGHTWKSPAQGGSQFTWKAGGRWKCSLICEDEQGVCVAQLTFPGLKLRKAARLDLYTTGSQALVEEILMTGLGVTEFNGGLGNVSLLG